MLGDKSCALHRKKCCSPRSDDLKKAHTRLDEHLLCVALVAAEARTLNAHLQGGKAGRRMQRVGVSSLLSLTPYQGSSGLLALVGKKGDRRARPGAAERPYPDDEKHRADECQRTKDNPRYE